MKYLLLGISALCWLSTALGQIKKGDVIIGGHLGFSVQDDDIDLTGFTLSSNSVYADRGVSFSLFAIPNISYAITNNLVAGLGSRLDYTKANTTLLYTVSTNAGFATGEHNEKAQVIAPTLHLQYLLFLGQKKKWAIAPKLNGEYGWGKRESIWRTDEERITFTDWKYLRLSFTPNIQFYATKHLLIEATLNGLNWTQFRYPRSKSSNWDFDLSPSQWQLGIFTYF